MRKLLSVIAITALLFTSTLAYAGPQGTVTISITISHDLSIEVGGGPVSFAVSPGDAPSVGTNAITVKNNGSGIVETISMKKPDLPIGWGLEFQFAEAKPAVGDANWQDAESISEAIACDVTKNLWVKLTVPLKTSLETLPVDLEINAS